MNFVYCEGCGARLSPRDRTCPKCGRPAPGILSAETSASDLAAGKTASFHKISSIADDIDRRTPPSLSDEIVNDAADPGTTTVLPVQDGGRRSQADRQSHHPDEDPYHARKFPWMRVGVAAALIACVAGCGYVVTNNPGGVIDRLTASIDRSASEMFPSRMGNPDGSSSGSDDVADATAEVADDHVVGNDQAYDVLYPLYETVGGFVDPLGDVITAFNGGYNNKSLAKRQETSAGAYALRDEVQSTINELDAIELSDDTLYAEDLEHLKSLAGWMYNRVDVICRAWDVSLSYPDGESMNQHTDEILEPLRDEGNKNLVLFEGNYEAWAPQKRE